MGLDCNVIPQIKVGDEYVDSKCFKDLWDRAKKLYFFNDTATTEIYTLSLHDALPIS